MMFFQNLFNHWESWAYSWTVILVLVGLGIFIMGLYSGDPGRRQAGMRVMRVGAILFIIFGGFFEMIFSTFQHTGIQQYIFPALLVLLGLYLVVIRSGVLPSKHPDSADQPVTSTDSSITSSEEKQ